MRSFAPQPASMESVQQPSAKTVAAPASARPAPAWLRTFQHAAASRSHLHPLVAPVDAPAERAADRAAERVQTPSAPFERNRHSEPVSARTPETPSPLVNAALQKPGQALSPETRAFFEPRFGRDLGAVRVHTDRDAAASARRIGARAYAAGTHIVFGDGHFAPSTDSGRSLLAHELAHVTDSQSSSSAAPLQRKPEPTAPEEATRPVPDWVYSTPIDALEGVPVSGYEAPRAAYTEADRQRLLAALNQRVQTNGHRLADFYHDLRVAWTDLVLDLSDDDGGLSLGEQTVYGIIGNLISAPLGTAAGIVVGVIADGIINGTDAVLSSRDQEARKQRMRDMLRAPDVSGAGETAANQRLYALLLDAVAYTAWLQSASLDDLGKFRVPTEFPKVPESEIRFEIAAAVLRYRAPYDMKNALRGASEETGTYLGSAHSSGSFKVIGPEFLQIHVKRGREGEIEWDFGTHAALLGAVLRRRVRELGPVAIVVTFGGTKDGYFDPDYEFAPRVVFGRDTLGQIHIQRGNFLGLFHLHAYAHPGEKPPTYEELQAKPPQVESYRHHFRESAVTGAAILFRDYIDELVLKGKPRK